MTTQTMKQGRRLYGFIKRNAEQPETMIELYIERERAGIDKMVASDIISTIHDYENKPTQETATKLEQKFKDIGMPDTFRIKVSSDTSTDTSTEPQPKHPAFAEFAQDNTKEDNTKEDKPPQQPTASELASLLDSLGLVLNSNTLDNLRRAIATETSLKDSEIERLMSEVKQLMTELEEEKNKPQEFTLPDLVPMDSTYIKHKDFDRVSMYVKAGVNVLLTGGAGTGKSLMARVIAKTLDMECFEQSLGGRMQYAQVIGSTQIENGTSYFKPSPLVEHLQKENTLVVLNEIFGLDPEVLLAFNDAFEKNTRHIRTPSGKLEVKATIIATANTTGRSVSRQYTGAQRADDSLLSRFSAKIHIDVDPAVEETLLKQVANDNHRAEIAKLVEKLRKGISQNNIAFDAGTRELTNCIDNYAAVGNVEMAFRDSFLGGLSDAELKKLGF